jgi:xylan 1,4-beta-xylosidase
MKLCKYFFALLLVCAVLAPAFAQAPEEVNVDATAPGTPFPHFWEQMFGSGRAILTLRSSYRHDLRAVKKVTGFEYVRFHGILLDEVGVYEENKQHQPLYNFTYVDQIYDGLLENGVRPFVEISFMPKELAARPDYQGFWYKPIVSPPKDYAQWDDLITQFTRNLVSRYGIEEVSQWYFEVWNEPNIDFWTGTPAEETYFELYDHTARDIKAVDPRLRVGGPATAQAAWIDDFITHTTQNKIPADFVSSHIYSFDKPIKIFGPGVDVSSEEMVYRGVLKMHDAVAASVRPHLPLIVSEFSDGAPASGVRDSIYMGPWLANVVRQCDGLTAMMSFWPFSDVFEEHGVADAPFADHSAREGRGLIGPDEVPKPSYVAFELLHRLGDRRIQASNDDVIVTRRADGTLVIALWNLVAPGDTGADRAFQLRLRHVTAQPDVTAYRLDSTHENTLGAYRAMGSPRYPTHAQVDKLWQVAKLAPAESIAVKKGQISINVPPDGLAILELRPHH